MAGLILAGLKLAGLLLGAWLDPDARRQRERARKARRLLGAFDEYAKAVVSEDGEAVDVALEKIDRAWRAAGR